MSASRELKVPLGEIAGSLALSVDEAEAPESRSASVVRGAGDRPLSDGARARAEGAGGRARRAPRDRRRRLRGRARLRALARADAPRSSRSPPTSSPRARSRPTSRSSSASATPTTPRPARTTFGNVLLFLPNEASPYADVNPDRRGARAGWPRSSTSPVELPWRVLVCRSPRSRARSSRATSVLRARASSRRRDRRSTATSSRRASPRPATCASRWSRTRARSRCAARSSTCGRRTPSSRCASSSTATSCSCIKPFDPDDQRTKKRRAELAEVWLPPAREAILTPGNVERAERPRARSLRHGRLALRRRRAPSSTTSPSGALLRLRGLPPRLPDSSRSPPTCPTTPSSCSKIPPAITRAAPRRARARRRRRRRTRQACRTSCRRRSTSTEGARRRALGARTVVALHRTPASRASTRGPGLAGALRGRARGHGDRSRRRAIRATSSARSRRRAPPAGKTAALDSARAADRAPGRSAGSASSSPPAPRRRSSGS